MKILSLGKSLSQFSEGKENDGFVCKK